MDSVARREEWGMSVQHAGSSMQEEGTASCELQAAR